MWRKNYPFRTDVMPHILCLLIDSILNFEF